MHGWRIRARLTIVTWWTGSPHPGRSSRRPRVPAECAYDYAIVRIVPRVERGEMINVGVIVSCPDTEFIAARIELDEARVRALDPTLDLATLRAHLATIPAICEGRADAGPIAALPARQRFYWLVSPRSTVIQVSPVHTGRTS